MDVDTAKKMLIDASETVEDGGLKKELVALSASLGKDKPVVSDGLFKALTGMASLETFIAWAAADTDPGKHWSPGLFNKATRESARGAALFRLIDFGLEIGDERRARLLLLFNSTLMKMSELLRDNCIDHRMEAVKVSKRLLEMAFVKLSGEMTIDEMGLILPLMSNETRAKFELVIVERATTMNEGEIALVLPIISDRAKLDFVQAVERDSEQRDEPLDKKKRDVLVAGLSMILRKQDCSEEAKTLRVKAMGIQTRLTDGKFIKKRQKFQGGPPSKDLGPKTRPIKDKR